jgi:HlyD family secretion protein
LNRARAEQQRVTGELAQAERDLIRSRELLRGGVIAAETLEAAELAVETLENSVKAQHASVGAAEAEVRMARASLLASGTTGGGQTIVIRSPIDGVVLQRLQESEAVVAEGEPLLEIGDVSNLEVVADFLSTDAVRIRANQKVLIERWGGGETIHGRVQRVEPSGFTKISALGVEEQRVNVIIDFDQPKDPAAQLGDRYRVEVRVVVWEAPAVVRIPVSSLVRHGDRWTVFVVTDGQAVRTPVEIEQRSTTEAEVLKGLAPDTAVIVFPSDEVEDGVSVDVVS